MLLGYLSFAYYLHKYLFYNQHICFYENIFREFIINVYTEKIIK